MIDIKKIKFIKNRDQPFLTSFVGLKKEGGENLFYLPHNFEDFDSQDFYKIKNFLKRIIPEAEPRGILFD